MQWLPIYYQYTILRIKKKKKTEKLCGLTYSIPPGKDRAGT